MTELQTWLAAVEARAQKATHTCGDKYHDCTCCDDRELLLVALRRAVEALTQVVGTYTNDVQRVAEADEPAAALTAHATLVDLARLLGEGERG